MSAAAITRRTPAPAGTGGTRKVAALSFRRIVASERIKFFSLRSTWWALAILAVSQIGIGLLMATAIAGLASGHPQAGSAQGQSTGIQVAVFATMLTQLIAAVLGAIAITGEYATGMIRSTLTAAPGRISSIFAKAIVIGAALFATGLASIVVTVTITTPILTPYGLNATLNDIETIVTFVLAAAYLACIAVFALCVGFLLRSGAGAIGGVLAAILVAPIILVWFPGETARTIATFLPSNAGQSMFMAPLSGEQLEPLQGLAVLALWVAGALVASAATLRARDA